MEEIHYIISEGLTYVQGGTFYLGDHYNEVGEVEQPVHSVTINDFNIGKYEVTHYEFIEFLDDFGVSSKDSYNRTQLIVLNDSHCAIDHNGSSFYYADSDLADTSECPVIAVTWTGSVVY